MNETPKNNWPGIRGTSDGKHSFSINIGNRTYIDGEYVDVESAARGYDEAKYALLQTGHLQRANFFHFPAEVSRWQNGETHTPQPCSALLTFMRVNPPRYLPYSQRQAEEKQKTIEKEENKIEKEKCVLTSSLPAPSKLLAAYKCLQLLHAATPQCLSPEEQSAVALLLPKLMTLLQ